MRSPNHYYRPAAVLRIICEAADAEGVHPREVTDNSREPRCVAARRRVMCALRDRGYSYPRIGRMLGGLDHTTVMYHLRGYKPSPPKPEPEPDWSIPDESGIWAI